LFQKELLGINGEFLMSHMSLQLLSQHCQSTIREVTPTSGVAALPHPFFIHCWTASGRGIALFMLDRPMRFFYQIV